MTRIRFHQGRSSSLNQEACTGWNLAYSVTGNKDGVAPADSLAMILRDWRLAVCEERQLPRTALFGFNASLVVPNDVYSEVVLRVLAPKWVGKQGELYPL